jgi:hypothetical protein
MVNFYRRLTPVAVILDPVFAKTSQKRSFSMTENERFGLVFANTGSINSGTGIAAALEPLNTRVDARTGQRILVQQTGTRTNAAIALATDASVIRHPHRRHTPPTGTGLLAINGFLFSQATTCIIEILNVWLGTSRRRCRHQIFLAHPEKT